MGTWNAGLFSNDITCDVKDTYMKFLEQQWGNQKAYQKTREEYEELIGTDEEALFVGDVLATGFWAVNTGSQEQCFGSNSAKRRLFALGRG